MVPGNIVFVKTSNKFFLLIVVLLKFWTNKSNMERIKFEQKNFGRIIKEKY